MGERICNYNLTFLEKYRNSIKSSSSLCCKMRNEKVTSDDMEADPCGVIIIISFQKVCLKRIFFVYFRV